MWIVAVILAVIILIGSAYSGFAAIRSLGKSERGGGGDFGQVFDTMETVFFGFLSIVCGVVGFVLFWVAVH